MAIVQQLAHIVSAPAPNLKPALRDRPQLIRMLLHPCFDGWIPLNPSKEPQGWVVFIVTSWANVQDEPRPLEAVGSCAWLGLFISVRTS